MTALRWYNRAAAWLCEKLLPWATPVWDAQADAAQADADEEARREYAEEQAYDVSKDYEPWYREDNL
mgnify:CR=1 FL=1